MPLTSEQTNNFVSHEHVTYWMAKYPHRATEVLAAVDVLSNDTEVNTEEQARAAIASAASAICEGINIFVSYKIGHGAAAKALLEPFEKFGSGRITTDESSVFPFLCERVGLAGTKYKDVIHNALEETHWFVLLLPEEAIGRSWTMFEAGFFRRAMHPGDRLVCIHHPTIEPTGPLEDFSRVVAIHDKIMKFYIDLLCHKGAIPGMNAINPKVTEDDLEPYVAKLVNLIRPISKVKRRYYMNYIDLNLGDGMSVDRVDDMLRARVIAGFRVDHLFGAGTEIEKVVQYESDAVDRDQTKEIALRELLAHLGGKPEQCGWVEELVEAIKSANAGGEPGAIDAAMKGFDDRYYRPVLHSVRRSVDGDQPISAHITFCEILSAPITRAPRRLDALSAALRLGYRFRWEILEEFGDIYEEEKITRVERILKRMEREAAQRGLYRPQITEASDLRNSPVVQAFVVPDEQDAVVKVQLEWQQYRNRDGAGKLDVAFESSDPDAVAECLSELRRLNFEFMRMAARRYAELVSEHWSDGP